MCTRVCIYIVHICIYIYIYIYIYIEQPATRKWGAYTKYLHDDGKWYCVSPGTTIHWSCKLLPALRIWVKGFVMANGDTSPPLRDLGHGALPVKEAVMWRLWRNVFCHLPETTSEDVPSLECLMEALQNKVPSFLAPFLPPLLPSFLPCNIPTLLPSLHCPFLPPLRRSRSCGATPSSATARTTGPLRGESISPKGAP